MKYIITIISLIFFIQKSFSQVKIFDKTYGAQGLDNAIYSDYVNQKHFVFGNISKSSIPLDLIEQFGGTDYAVVIYDTKGNIIKRKAFGGEGNENLCKVIKSSKGYYLIGTSTSTGDSNTLGNKGVVGNCAQKKLNTRSFKSGGTYVWKGSNNGAWQLVQEIHDTLSFYTQVVEESKKEIYIVEIDTTGDKISEYAICSPAIPNTNNPETIGNYFTTFLTNINDVYKDASGNWILTFTYHYSEYTTNAIERQDLPKNPAINDEADQWNKLTWQAKDGAFYGGTMVLDSNWKLLKTFNYLNQLDGYFFSAHSEIKNYMLHGNENTAGQSYSLPTGGMLYTGNFCTTEDVPTLINYFAGAFITNKNGEPKYSKVFTSGKSQSKMLGSYFDGKYYYFFIEDTPNTSNTTDLFSYYDQYIPGTFYKRAVPPHANLNKKDIWVVKLSSTLQVISETAIGSANDTYFSSISYKENSTNIFLSCYTNSSILYDKTTMSKGGLDYWVIEFDPIKMKVVKDITYGSPNDDRLAYTQSKNGVLQFTGVSKGGINTDKSEKSRDNETYGDFWTLVYCVKPIVDFNITVDTIESGAIVSFNNTSTYSSSYLWDFGDGAISYEKDAMHYFYMPGFYDIKLTCFNPAGCSDSITKHKLIFVELPKHRDPRIDNDPYVKEIGLNSAFIYPNPANNEINIYTKNSAQIKIFDALGKLILETVKEAENTTIQLTNLPAGIYFTVINQGNEISNLKFIKN